MKEGPDNPLDQGEVKDLRDNPKEWRRIWQNIEKGWRVEPRVDERPKQPPNITIDTNPEPLETESMKRFLPSIALIALLAVTGCGTVKSVVTPAVVQSGVSTGVRFGVSKYPTAIPAVRIATEVICSAANGTNVSPAEIVAAIEKSSFENLKTPEAIFITQGIVNAYTIVWNSFASDAVSQSEALPYLQAVCNGGRDGLSGLGAAATGARSFGKPMHWPQLRFK